MANTTDVLRGHIDMIVLARLAAGDCYGYRVARDIHGAAGGLAQLKEATLYSAFRRLEKEGLISSYWGDEQHGARRRYYAATEAGRGELAGMKAAWSEMKTVVDALLRADDGRKADE